jgi:predicted amidohydrolase
MTVQTSHQSAAATESAAHWRRFRQLMALMFGMAVVACGLAGLYLWRSGVAFHLHMVIAIVGAITLSLLLSGALMGLVFLSNRSGHDADVNRGDA